MKIQEFRCENQVGAVVTDEAQPTFSYYVTDERRGARIKEAVLELNGSRISALEQTAVAYRGNPLKPFTEYVAKLTVTGADGGQDTAAIAVRTGRMNTPWVGKWITDGKYRFTEKGTSPVPMLFRKRFAGEGFVRAEIYCTALGIFELELNGKKVGKDYFAPGFTSYSHQLQYMTYDITHFLEKENELTCTVGGGWAVGAFVMTRKNRITAPRQALLAEIRLTRADGSGIILGTDASWEVTTEGKLRFAEFYDGEVYDATKEVTGFHKASLEQVKIRPQLIACYGAPVRAHEVFKPVSVRKAPSGELVYDFGQNFAGVVRFRLNGRAGQKVVIRHAEVLTQEGELNTAFLRSAKCKIEYTAKEGAQSYSPRMTYMGFRYAGITGVEEHEIEVEAVALYSDVETIGSFTSSNPMLNKLQSNLVWSGKSNFVDIPTDCPQRDERMGWTGDIAIFAPTACYNFDMARFLEKWLKDVRSEQTRHGGIPNTVPTQGYGFPVTMPKKAIAFWGDACVFVPWALYRAYGDLSVLKENYATMKKYVKACKFWANIGIGKHRYIWSDIPAMQFGDWVAPDVPKMGQWQARCKWTGTAAFAASTGILAKIAALLGNEKDAAYYRKLNGKISNAYVSLLTDGNGKLKEEFQTAYVLPLYFEMFPEEQRRKAAENLVALIEKNEYCIGTGFPGTPYILFALADHGYADVAYKMLLNTKCPSWLYEVKVGATTVWERWDGLDEDGVCRIGNDGTGGMISFNHYGFGSVGDFLYKRIAGIESMEGGYKKMRIAPVYGGELTYVNASLKTPYGVVSSSWRAEEGVFTLEIAVPVGTECEVVLPGGETHVAGSGVHIYSVNLT